MPPSASLPWRGASARRSSLIERIGHSTIIMSSPSQLVPAHLYNSKKLRSVHPWNGEKNMIDATNKEKSCVNTATAVLQVALRATAAMSCTRCRLCVLSPPGRCCSRASSSTVPLTCTRTGWRSETATEKSLSSTGRRIRSLNTIINIEKYIFVFREFSSIFS